MCTVGEHTEYLAEATELLDRLGEELLGLKTSDTASQLKAVNEAFRSAHSFKGLSSLFGFQRSADLAHALEDLLDELRVGKQACSDDVEHCLFMGYDGLRSILNDPKAVWDEASFQNELHELTTVEAPSSISLLPPDIYRLPVDLEGVLSEAEEHLLMTLLRQGEAGWLLTVQLPLNDLSAALEAITLRIEAESHLIASVPGEVDGNSGRIEFQLVLTSTKEEAALQEVVRADEGILTPLPSLVADEPALSRDPLEAEPSDPVATPTIRIEIERLDQVMHTVGELHVLKAELNQLIDQQSRHVTTEHRQESNRLTRRLEKQLENLRQQTLDLRTVPARLLFHRMHRIVRQAAHALQKKVRLEVSGADTRLDKVVMEELATPLLHLLRNAVDHGIEPPDERRRKNKLEEGTIQLDIKRVGHQVRVLVTDDGAGIDLEKLRNKAQQQGVDQSDQPLSEEALLDLAFTPGFSSRQQVNAYSGRGVGLDVVRSNMARLGGTVAAVNHPGEGLSVHLTMPMSMNLLPTLSIQRAGQDYVLPVSMVLGTQPYESTCQTVENGTNHYQFQGQTVPLVDVASVFRLKPEHEVRARFIVGVGADRPELAFLVDAIHGQQESVIQPLGPLLDAIPGLSGAAVSSNERLVMMLDVAQLKAMAQPSLFVEARN